MKKIIILISSFLLLIACSFFVSPIGEKNKPKPLNKYAFENLKAITPEKSQIKVDGNIFFFQSEGKTITGQINIPDSDPPESGYPVILMLRGYIDPETYKTGDGTKNAAKFFAAHGFLTLAPDFLGYGGSDDGDVNSIVARLKRPYNLLTLLNSLDSLPYAISSMPLIWAHSNGGQIALSLLEITGKNYPTTLWAPVSKPFPYSILYYTDEYDDRGKAIRKVIADFEENYDVDKFSIDQYLDWINAPMQVHQGLNDDAVPFEWSNQLVEKLNELEKEVTYYTYPSADHNLRPNWNTVIQRDLIFFNKHL